MYFKKEIFKKIEPLIREIGLPTKYYKLDIPAGQTSKNNRVKEYKNFYLILEDGRKIKLGKLATMIIKRLNLDLDQNFLTDALQAIFEGYTFKFTRNIDEIREAYETVLSCMSGQAVVVCSIFQQENDLELLIVKKNDEIIARCVVNRKQMIASAIYSWDTLSYHLLYVIKHKKYAWDKEEYDMSFLSMCYINNGKLNLSNFLDNINEEDVERYIQIAIERKNYKMIYDILSLGYNVDGYTLITSKYVYGTDDSLIMDMQFYEVYNKDGEYVNTLFLEEGTGYKLLVLDKINDFVKEYKKEIEENIYLKKQIEEYI